MIVHLNGEDENLYSIYYQIMQREKERRGNMINKLHNPPVSTTVYVFRFLNIIITCSESGLHKTFPLLIGNLSICRMVGKHSVMYRSCFPFRACCNEMNCRHYSEPIKSIYYQ